MSLLKADQLRRDLFIKYSDKIAELLGETEECSPTEEQREKEEIETTEQRGLSSLPKRFRISYPRQHLLRQRAMQMPPAADVGDAENSPASASNSTCPPLGETATDEDENVETIWVELDEEEKRPVYNEPYPSVKRMMRRMQDESLRLLMREARIPVTPHQGDAYLLQRMEVLQQLEKNIGDDRIKILARLQKMDGKLHTCE
ncbi:hypothetical protein, conserved [Trypanosoma brucei brucei TREU927]|uniref:Uncharacterized protein n=1 Tax=Trypanosoma brucei brucei (strain 927/4 GUTat10.1) TaxID=185431 RepID=Q57XE5_TRYB2|nr:hypothetical protein, conserved [Trypanosoma brucei brucei TREU927]AAX69706.1 hypothetical protein, conserved [Trypanosoma brucei]AAZ13011.1 hypothetical protein, conserved [Trypanosoma brucei brucei TREU927]